MFDFGLSVIKNISTFGVIYTRLMLKLESDEKNYIRQETIFLFYSLKLCFWHYFFRSGEILKDLITENNTITAKPLQVHLLGTVSQKLYLNQYSAKLHSFNINRYNLPTQKRTKVFLKFKLLYCQFHLSSATLLTVFLVDKRNI